MFKNYLKTAVRNFQKNKVLSLINLGGLSAGIAAVLLIGLYIYSETGYEDFQQNKASIYRVGFKFWQSGKLLGDGAEFTPPFGADAAAAFPEIKSYTRISSDRTAFISYNEKSIKVDYVHHADSSFFNVFSYKLLQGNAKTVLTQPYCIVLTNRMASTLFGKQNAIGKVVRIDNQTNYLVTGVAEDAPENSHLNYNALISFATLYSEPGNYMDWNGGEQYITYLQLKNGVDAAALQKKFTGFMWKHINQQYATRGIKVDAYLQPLKDIHLYYGDDANTLRTNLYVFSAVALLILLISCVNYINLTTAQSITRFKEIGVRKVLGAGRPQLIKQFLTETIGITISAFVISLVLVNWAAPAYEAIIGKKLPPLNAGMVTTLLLLLLLVMAIGFIAGSYVAFYLSSFSATRIFKSLMPKSGQGTFRKTLITGQFAITVALMVSTVIITLQLRFSKNVPMGFDKEHVLVVPLIGKDMQASNQLMQQQLGRISAVQQITAVSEVPYNGISNNGFIPEGGTKAMVIHQLVADENLLKVFNIKMAGGHFFSKNLPSEADGYVINEALAKTLGWANPLGKIISRNGDHRIIGVVKDFHFASMHDQIEPLIISNKPDEMAFSYLAIKYQTNDASALIDAVKHTWALTAPTAAFDYWFLDDAFNTIYKSEERFRTIFIYFSGLSILLSLAGVFGLVNLSIKQRTKEFGVRRVLGASVANIIQLISKEFVRLIVLGTLVATPIAWYYMDAWLQHFAYRIHNVWWVFAACGMAVLVITVITISVQAIKAALVKPVKNLRTE